MPRTSERSGPQTRARISEIATVLFLERGFDEVTVAEVAREAGVSSVTVFKHFPRKEDLLLDRTPEAADLLRLAVRGAVGDGAAGVGGAGAAGAAGAAGVGAAEAGVLGAVLDGLEAAAVELAEELHSLSGLAPGAAPFFRTIAGSAALASRSREISSDLAGVLAAELERAGCAPDEAALAAALILAGYGTVLVGTARRVTDGWGQAELVADHRIRLDAMFRALRSGLA